MAPSVPTSLQFPDLKKLLVDANMGLSSQTAAVSLQIKLSPTPRAWENSIPKGEENESLKEKWMPTLPLPQSANQRVKEEAFLL